MFRWMFGRSRSRRAIGALAVFGVIVAGLGGWMVVSALAAGPSAPTLTAQPSNPTNSSSASFTYTDSGNVARFECQLDGTGFSTCGTSKTSTRAYSGLATGPHTF